jgi:hypothetical protein
MEYVFNETIPTGWKQGYFSFGTKKRLATVTDSKFISDNKLVVAHRSNATLYLIEISDNDYRILNRLLLKFNNKYYHPDLISIENNRIYMTAYTNISCIVDIVNDQLKFIKLIKIHEYILYHGCFVKNNLMYYGGIKDKDKNTPLTIYDYNTNNTRNIKINYNRRIKTISIYNNNILLGVDGKNSDITIFDSWILYYTLNDTFDLLDSIYIPNTQIDGSVIYNNYFFITLHDAIDKCGYIYVGTINDINISYVKKVKCNNFPHGIDVYNNKLAYTSYTNGSVTIHSLDEFL